jgi:Uma2 family endonuclease
MSAAPKPARFDNIGEILKDLGVAARRVRAYPPPGKATEKDVIAIHDRTDRLYELVDGVLVEKIMSFPESALTCDLIKLLGYYLDQNPVGFLAGPDGAVRLMPGLVRIPDVSFISWDQLPKRERPTDPIAGLAPDLAVEVLSKGNTKREMDRKVREYFLCGVRLVWLVALTSRTVQVYTAPDQATTLGENQTLDGGDVLPGLALPLRRLFAEVPMRPNAAGGRTKRHKPRRPNGA